MSLESYVLGLQKEQEARGFARVAQAGLASLSRLYEKGVLRRRAKDTARVVDAGIPVISVGNITAGGTGKTPCILYLADLLRQWGRHPAILTRGYKGGFEKKGGLVSNQERILASQKEAGDEPYMMAAKLTGIPVIAGRDRVVSAAAAKALGADVLLLDDGFQYWRLKRNLDIVLLDATNPFGGGHMLPRGLLREPMEALSRAGLFVLTKADQVSGEMLSEIKGRLLRYAPEVPVIVSSHQPSLLFPLHSWPQKGEAPKETEAFLLSGIGNPGAFRKTAEDAGLTVKGTMDLADHHSYEDEDLEKAVDLAQKAGASILVMTEKDAVKIKANCHWDTIKFPLFVLGITFRLDESGERLCTEKVEAVL